jgi:hypothetical protein
MIRGSAIALLLLWVLAVFTGRTMGGFIHVLLVLGLVLGLASLITRQMMAAETPDGVRETIKPQDTNAPSNRKLP